MDSYHVLNALGLIKLLWKCLLYCSQCTNCSCLSNNNSALYSCIIDIKLLIVVYVYLIDKHFFPSRSRAISNIVMCPEVLDIFIVLVMFTS